MLQRLQAAIDSCDLQVINMHKVGGGQQILTAHFSRKESRFDLYTVSIVPDIVCYIVSDIVFLYFKSTDIVDDIVYDIVCNMEDTVQILAVGCLNKFWQLVVSPGKLVRLETFGSAPDLERLCTC
jgi:hypothetical protein